MATNATRVLGALALAWAVVACGGDSVQDRVAEAQDSTTTAPDSQPSNASDDQSDGGNEQGEAVAHESDPGAPTVLAVGEHAGQLQPPALAGDLVVAGADDGAVRAWNVADGTVEWERQLVPDDYTDWRVGSSSDFFGPPVVVDDQIVVGWRLRMEDPESIGGDTVGLLAVLDAGTGTVVWTVSGTDVVPTASPVVVDDRVVWPVSETQLGGFSFADGAKDWASEEFRTPIAHPLRVIDGQIIAPLAAGNGLLASVDPASGETTWISDHFAGNDRSDHSPVLVGDELILPTVWGVEAMDAATGETVGEVMEFVEGVSFGLVEGDDRLVYTATYRDVVVVDVAGRREHARIEIGAIDSVRPVAFDGLILVPVIHEGLTDLHEGAQTLREDYPDLPIASALPPDFPVDARLLSAVVAFDSDAEPQWAITHGGNLSSVVGMAASDDGTVAFVVATDEASRIIIARAD